MDDSVEFVLCYGGDGAVLEVFSEGHGKGGCFLGGGEFFLGEADEFSVFYVDGFFLFGGLVVDFDEDFLFVELVDFVDVAAFEFLEFVGDDVDVEC